MRKVKKKLNEKSEKRVAMEGINVVIKKGSGIGKKSKGRGN